MKKLILPFIALLLLGQISKAQTVVLDANGVTVKWTGTTVPNPRFVQASPRGTLEWFAVVNNSTKINITNYANGVQSGISFFTPTGQSTPIPFNNIVTTLVTNVSNMFNGTFFNQPIGSWDLSNVTNMSRMFAGAGTFNQPIGSWNVSNVTDMSRMFDGANAFNQPIGSWNVSNVTDMSYMFAGAGAFNQPIGSWNVINVTNMVYMFYDATAFNQPIGSWNVSNVTDMSFMFAGAGAFNQPIGSWNVSNVTDMSFMFDDATAFNQPIGSWDVSNVTGMSFMFQNALVFNQPIGSWNVSSVTNMVNMFWGGNEGSAFNQPIGYWNVSNVTNMRSMFTGATAFNQPIENWNVSNVTDMSGMFWYAGSFNQPIGSWNVSSVTTMAVMFSNAYAFNQPISCWNVSNVTNMIQMFDNAFSFNQNIGDWNVSKVTNMSDMFLDIQLSTANFDALLIGWSTIGPNETSLKPNVTFSGGNSKYCNGATARNSIISTYGWTITSGVLNCINIGTAGPNCQSLDTDNFNISSLKLFPNPVLYVLNVKVDSNLINQPYNVVDGLGRVVLNGNIKDVDTSINVEQLSKGIYYLKVSANSASKFIKE